MSDDTKTETETPTQPEAPPSSEAPRDTSVPEVEYAEPSWAAVEPDEIASVRLFVQIGVLTVIVVLLMLGAWRFLKAQTSDQLKRKEARDTNNEALILDREATKELQARTPDPKTGRPRMPIQEALSAVVRDPSLLRPLSRPLAMAPAKSPAMAPAKTPATAPARTPARPAMQ